MQSNNVKILVIVIAVAVIVSGAAAFLITNNNKKEDNALYEVVDFAGNNIKLDNVPEKIITLNALSTEMICELGLTANLVGVTSDAGVHDVTNFIYGMDFDIGYPDQLKAQIANGKTALVGPVTSWTTDQVMKYDPDLVIFQNSTDNLNKMKLLQDMGITCIVTNNTYDSVSVIYDNMELLGKALGRSDRAELFNNSMKETLDYIYAVCKGFNGKDVIVLADSRGSLYAYNYTSLRHVILREMGCTTNMAGEATGVVTAENILEYQPDVIIMGVVEPSVDVENTKNKLESDTLWAEVEAVKNGSIYYLGYYANQATSYTSHHLVHGVALMATIVFDEMKNDVPQTLQGESYLEHISWIDEK